MPWLTEEFRFTSAVLVLSSRSLPARASLVYWEALLRYVAAVVLIPAALFGDIGYIAALLGLIDLVIGLVYMFGLPRALKVSHAELLLDRQNDHLLRGVR